MHGADVAEPAGGRDQEVAGAAGRVEDPGGRGREGAVEDPVDEPGRGVERAAGAAVLAPVAGEVLLVGRGERRRPLPLVHGPQATGRAGFEARPRAASHLNRRMGFQDQAAVL